MTERSEEGPPAIEQRSPYKMSFRLFPMTQLNRQPVQDDPKTWLLAKTKAQGKPLPQLVGTALEAKQQLIINSGEQIYGNDHRLSWRSAG